MSEPKLRRALVAPEARERNQQERRAKDAAGRWQPHDAADAVERRSDASARPKPAMRRSRLSIRPPCRPSSRSSAGSDIRAFLQSGVPADLTKAALRRAWTTDPAIRDFIGIAENQWDFTDPTSIPGFGPLQAGDDIGQLVAQAMGKLPDAPRGLSRQYGFNDRRGVDRRDRTPRGGNTSSVWRATRNQDRRGPAARVQYKPPEHGRSCCIAAC